MGVVGGEGGGGVAATGRRAAVQFQTEPDKAEFVPSLFGSLSPPVSWIHRKEEFVCGVSNANRLDIHNSPPTENWVEFLLPLRPLLLCQALGHSLQGPFR